MNIFQHSKNLEGGIISAMHNRRAPDNLRGKIAAGSFDAVREHHGSVNLLIDKGKNGSAFALLRSMFDGCIVGLWATYIASDELLAKFEAGRFTVEPQKVIKQLKTRDDGDYTDTLQRIYDQSWKPLSSYVHGGRLQVSRRNAAAYIGPAYSEEEIEEVLIFSNAMLIMAAMEMPTLTNDHEFSGEINKVINQYLQAVANNQVQPTADVSASVRQQTMAMLEALEQATQAIGASYFLLPIAGRDRPIQRERVYCYELFHQLRQVFRDSQLTLTGEPDKRGHPDFPPINPDFILHAPGGHEKNTAAVEVEFRVGLEHLIKDLGNLKTMRDRGYRSLVLLLFANNSVPWPKLTQAARAAGIDRGEITVFLHRAAGQAATREYPPATTAA